MKFLVDALIEWPRSQARHLEWLGPRFARIVVGSVFLGTGWGKLTHLPLVTDNFANWGIPAPLILAPFVSGVEFFGGILLLAGLLTRSSAEAIGVVMVVAVKSAQWHDVDSLQTLLGLEQVIHLAIFPWLAIAGAGRNSLDQLFERPRTPG